MSRPSFFLHSFRERHPTVYAITAAVLIVSVLVTIITGGVAWLTEKIMLYLAYKGYITLPPPRPKYNLTPVAPPPQKGKSLQRKSGFIRLENKNADLIFESRFFVPTHRLIRAN